MTVIPLKKDSIKTPCVAAIGFFDGVHIAHQTLIEETIGISKQKNLPAAVITFDKHPKSVLYDFGYHYITPLSRKLEKFKALGIDTVYVIEFTKEKAKMDPVQFIKRYFNNIDTLVCGFDFKFGVRGSGNIELLREHSDFETVVVKEITYGGFKVGSTHIRDLIKAGQVELIEEVLGERYMIAGPVVHGQKKGRLIGYPTANIDADHYLMPKQGVYITRTKVDGVWYDSMSSIGHNPTMNCQVELSLESHILGFDKEIYGEIIEIEFVQRLRDELKFSSLEALIAKIDQDKLDTLNYFKKNRK